jgi:hypothetical protein
MQQLAVAACLLALSIEASTAATSDDNRLPVTAIWHVQSVPLNLHTLHTYYSCESLREKITKVLTALGAREDVYVDMGCDETTFTNRASAEITLATPIEATPENVAAATTYSSERQLVARVKGEQLPTANDLQRFDAEWRSVALHKQRKLGIDPADCDLLQALASQVFPRLGIRMEARKYTCPDHTFTRALPQIRVTALVAAPPPVPIAAARPLVQR